MPSRSRCFASHESYSRSAENRVFQSKSQSLQDQDQQPTKHMHLSCCADLLHRQKKTLISSKTVSSLRAAHGTKRCRSPCSRTNHSSPHRLCRPGLDACATRAQRSAQPFLKMTRSKDAARAPGLPTRSILTTSNKKLLGLLAILLGARSC